MAMRYRGGPKNRVYANARLRARSPFASSNPKRSAPQRTASFARQDVRRSIPTPCRCKRFVQENGVGACRVHGVPPGEEHPDVVAGAVSKVEVGAARVVGDDPSRGDAVALEEDPLEGLLVAIAAHVDALDVRPRERPAIGDGADERRASDVAELAVVAKRGRGLGGAGHRCAENQRQHDNALHHRFTTE